MNRKWILSVLVLPIFGGVGCDDGPPRTTSNQSRLPQAPPFDAPERPVKIDRLALPVIEVGSAPITVIKNSEEDERYDLYNIGNVIRLSSGEVVIVGSQRSPRLFDSRGKFIRELGRTGSGPGESQSVSQLGRFSGDSVVVFDNALGRVSVFTREGRFVRSVQLPGNIGQSLGEFSEDGSFYGERNVPSASSSGSKYREKLYLYEFNTRSAAQRLIGEINGQWMIDRAGSAPFSAFPKAAFGRGQYYVSEGETYDIMVFHDGKPAFEIKADLPRRRVTDSDLAKWGRYDSDIGDSLKYMQYVQKVRGEAVTHHSQIYQLLAGEDGFLWVRGQALPGEDSKKSDWIIFDPNGTPVARTPVTIEDGILRAVGSDYVIVMRYEADMPSTLEVWPITRAPRNEPEK